MIPGIVARFSFVNTIQPNQVEYVASSGNVFLPSPYNGTSISITIPATVEDGDLIFVFLLTRISPNSVTPPPGFIKYAGVACQNTPFTYNQYTLPYARIASASDAGSTVTFNFDSTTYVEANCVVYRGASTPYASSFVPLYSSINGDDYDTMMLPVPSIGATDSLTVYASSWIYINLSAEGTTDDSESVMQLPSNVTQTSDSYRAVQPGIRLGTGHAVTSEYAAQSYFKLENGAGRETYASLCYNLRNANGENPLGSFVTNSSAYGRSVTLESVRWFDGINMFVSVDRGATDTDAVALSCDGVRWETVSPSASTQAWYDVAYSPTLGSGYGRLLVCAASGTDRISYSDDFGQTWNLVSTPNDSKAQVSCVCGAPRFRCLSPRLLTSRQEPFRLRLMGLLGQCAGLALVVITG